MHPDFRRVLIVDDDQALLFSLTSYLTFRGCCVDCTEAVSDARALVRHVRYGLLVIGVGRANLAGVRALAAELRDVSPETRLMALTTDSASLDAFPGGESVVDQVLPRYLPLDQLARTVCSVIAA